MDDAEFAFYHMGEFLLLLPVASWLVHLCKNYHHAAFFFYIYRVEKPAGG